MDFWDKAFVWAMIRILTNREIGVSNELTLGDVLEFLEENPDKMYVLKSKKAAMVYSTPAKAVILIEGDFDGSPEWCNFELQRRMYEMEQD